MSESDVDFVPDDVSAELTTGPGRRLKLARERAGLKRSEVADRLHLGEDLIEAIENDDHERLPGPVFTKGYMRNYARLVNEPVEELLQSVPDTGRPEEARPALRQFKSNSQMKARRQVSSSHGGVRVFTWLIVIGLIVLLVVWWRGYLPISIPVPLLGTTQDSPVTTIMGGSSSDTIVLEKPVTQKAETEPVSRESGSLPVLPEAALPAAPATPAGEDDSSDDAAAPPKTGSNTAPLDEAAVVSGAEPTEPTLEPVPQTLNQGVVFEFSAPCWVDVRDSNGQKVLYGGIGGGERHVLEGEPPYQVVLGDSRSVNITVNGEAVTPPVAVGGRRVARFALNPDEYGMVSARLGQ